MYQILKKYFNLIVIITIYPIFIHIIFKLHTSCKFIIAEWSSGDMLNYGASIIQVIATIYAIKLTIDFTIQNQKDERKLNTDSQKEDRRLAIKPYLSSEHESVYKLLKIEDNRLFIIINNQYKESNDINSYTYQVTVYKSNNILNDVFNDLEFRKNYYIIEYVISNYGAGNALELKFTIVINNIEKIIHPILVLPKDHKRSFVFVFTNSILPDNANEILIQFKLEYNDIESLGKYYQYEKFEFSKNVNDMNLLLTQKTDCVLCPPIKV